VFLEVEHHLTFDYDAFISESFLELRVQPKTTASQTLAAFSLAVGPPASVHRYRDWNDNIVYHFTVTKYHRRIKVVSRSLVHTHPATPPLAAVVGAAPAADLAPVLHDFLRFGGPVVTSPLLRRAYRAIPITAQAPLGEQVRAVGRYVHGHFAYEKNVTRYDSTTEDFLRLGAGVCQDFTHLMLAFLRLRGIPCRYVSGYLQVERTAGEPAQSHAWIEFHAPGHGWVPFDPTHDREIDERYVVIGHGRHYDDVPPNKGIYRGNAEETLSAEVFTRETAPRTFSTLQEEIHSLDLPVFSEVPVTRPPHAATAAAAAEQQQQQQ
jgi:transglutaminase-like putative cysteine protease